jgi:hypothetical protein
VRQASRRARAIKFLAMVGLVLTSACGLAPHASHCTNSDGSACPASYFSGPLGANNIVPAGTGALLIEEYGGIGREWPQKQAGLIKRERALGRKFDGIHIEYWAGGTWDGVQGMEDPTRVRPTRESWAIGQGASFVAVSWTPDFTIAQMNDGVADAIWAKAAEYWKTFAPTRIMLRPFVEFDNPSPLYSTVPAHSNGVNYCGEPLRRAWRRMVGVFQRNGASNVGFWFTPSEGQDRRCVQDSYPGDKYVDWVGSDAYNVCRTKDDLCYATPLHPGASTFGELFNYAGTCADGATCPPNQHDLFGSRKPFVVGETGSIYDVADPAMKGQFYLSIIEDSREMKYLRGVSFFDQDVSATEGPDENWFVDAPVNNHSVFDGFKELTDNAWFNTGVRLSAN